MIAIVLFTITTQAQTAYTTTGNWFNFSTAHYEIKIIDELLIVDTIASGKVSTTKWYTLSSGVKIQILHPQPYLDLLNESYGTSNLEDLKDSLKASKETLWNINMPLTNNSWFCLLTNTTKYVPNYSGAAKLFPVIALSGKAKIKRSCGNVQIPIVTLVVNNTVVNNNTTTNNSIPQDNVVDNGNNNYNYNYNNGPKMLDQSKATVVPTSTYYFDPITQETGWSDQQQHSPQYVQSSCSGQNGYNCNRHQSAAIIVMVVHYHR